MQVQTAQHRALRLAIGFGVALTASLLGCVGIAGAAGPFRSGPWVGEYSVALESTSQHATWSWNHTQSSSCDFTGSGSGSEDRTLTGGAANLSVTGAAAPGLLGVPASSISVQFGSILSLPGSGTVTRQGSTTFTASGCGAGGGGGGQTVAPDCGTKAVNIAYELAPVSDHQLRWSGQRAASSFESCPFQGVFGLPDSMPLDVAVNPAHFGPGLGPVTLRGDGTEPVTEPDTTGLTTANVRLKITPLAITPALVFASRKTSLPADDHGSVDVPVACSAAGACGGTLGAGFGALVTPVPPSAAAARAASAAKQRYPAPVLNKPGTLAKARFKVRARGHGHVRLKFDKSVVPSLGTVPMLVWVTTRVHHATITYAIASITVSR
jgi:hypothetical protein